MGEKLEVEEWSALDTFIGLLVWLFGLVGLFLAINGWLGWLPFAKYGISGIVGGILLMLVAALLTGVQVVPPPEVWIIERFGKYKKTLKSGIRYVIPIVERIRAKLKTYEQPIPLFDSLMKIDFRDGSADIIEAKLFASISDKNPQDAIYKVKNWDKWVDDATEPIVRGYLNTLSIKEALDEGRARGNLLDRLKEAPDVTQKQIDKIQKRIEEIEKDLKGIPEEKARPLRLLFEEFKKEKSGMELRHEDQQRLKETFEKLEKEAKKRGIGKIHRVVVAEFDLDENVIKAREKVLEEARRAEAAIFEAAREATLRTESIKRAKERLVEIGYPPKDALRKAYELEIIETLANTGSLFLTRGGEGIDLASMIAQAAAIYSEVSKRREKKT
jgi:regulator of protease activity HflC (stomatin/prohibitin superfamily)